MIYAADLTLCFSMYFLEFVLKAPAEIRNEREFLQMLAPQQFLVEIKTETQVVTW